ncbi:MAG: LysM peptidoglycan-binding domain-containing protein [Chitinophagaceae bacterium]|nr:LysM peptidoglycan-binding domain-containing protein [Chitinophagaceae bacterium]
MKAILFSILFLISFVAKAQQTKFYAGKNEKGVFVEHKVQPKENWYSIGRMYAISPKEIAAFNDLSMDKGLSIGQALNIPLNSNNFIQSVSAVGIPVYHAVQAKEGLLKIAANYGLTLAGIKNLNGLNTDQISAGYNLIVGYIGAVNQSSTISVTNTTTAQVAAPAPVVTPPVQNNKAAVAPNQTKPSAALEQPKETATKPVVKTPATLNQNQTSVAETKLANTTPTNYFATGFSQQIKDGKEQRIENATYGIFKSSSGWQDGKYYLLINDVLPGTIVKVSAIATGKVIYAKVLGAVPPGKESEGLVLRLSNAAATALGVESSGTLSLVWYK